MAHVLDEPDFWLSPPPYFLSESTEAGGGAAASWKSTEADGKLAFSRREFPYEFGAFKSELSSPVDSLATAESEEEDFFAELDRRLTLSEFRKFTPLDLRQPSDVPKALGGSPQSILGGIGSWSGRSSNESHQSPQQGPLPSATAYEAEYDSSGLIYAAAGQAERMKRSNEGPFKASVNGQVRVGSNTKSERNYMPPIQNHNAMFLAEQNYLAAAGRAYYVALLYEQHLKTLNRSASYAKTVSGVGSHGMTLQHRPRLSTKANFQSTPLQRNDSVGTGVFLPRRYNTSPAAPPRKRAVATNAVVPAKVVQALNMSFEEEINPLTGPHCSAYATSMSQKNYVLMARRNAFLAQQQRRAARADDLAQSNLEVCLPQEWSY